MPKIDRFQLIQKKYRKKFLVLQKHLQKEYEEINGKLMDKIQRLAFDFAGPDGTFSKGDQDRLQLEIDAITYWFTNEMTEWVDKNIVESADIAIQGQDTAAEHFIRAIMDDYGDYDRALLLKAISDGGSGILLRARFGTGLSKMIRKAVWNHRWEDGLNLSDRIWKLNQVMSKNIKTMVEKSINEGKAAVNFAKAVEDYLEKPGPLWRTDIKPGLQEGDIITTKTGVSYAVKKPRATVKYNALRLARTETNQAYHRAQKFSDKESIIVKGTKWNLSSSHPDYGYYEICEKRAREDHHGLGLGVYRPGQTPFDHPNGLCYLTSVLCQGDELIEILRRKYAA